MFRENFYAQIGNPAYFRTDQAKAFSFAGFAGISFVNQGNYRIADVITVKNGNPVVDFNHFYANSKSNNVIRQDLTIPVLYAGIPLNDGYFHFFYNENLTSVTGIRKEALAFLSNGNLPAEYLNFSSKEILQQTLGYREFSFGYGKPINDDLNIGVRSKLIFGAVFADTKSWDYGIFTSSDGDSILLTSTGTGQLMVPFKLTIRDDKSFHSMNTDGAPQKYMTAYQNPGFALDFGFTYSTRNRHFISAALRDIGAIWFHRNAYDVSQNQEVVFEGFDLVSAIRYPEEIEYKNPGQLVDLVKDRIRDVYQPIFEESEFLHWLPVKSVIHYNYRYSQRHVFGATSQMSISRNNLRSVFTLTARQKWLNFSLFENVNLQGISGITLGAGLHYEGDDAQFFIATDNLPAFYHPAANRTFSINFGLCFLLNHKKAANEETISSEKGKASPFLPFYERKK